MVGQSLLDDQGIIAILNDYLATHQRYVAQQLVIVGGVECPVGPGKTLALICMSMTLNKGFERRVRLIAQRKPGESITGLYEANFNLRRGPSGQRLTPSLSA